MAILGLLIVVFLSLVVILRSARQADIAYHADLQPSIQLSSSAFENNGRIPVAFSCSGDGISPPLTWSNLPEGTKSLVLLMTDIDIPTPSFQALEFVHWVLYNIPGDTLGLPEAVTDAELSQSGVIVGRNGSGQRRYYPPCPPFGSHRYVFRLYALDLSAIQPERGTKGAVMKAMEGHILAYGELTGTYGKQAD